MNEPENGNFLWGAAAIAACLGEMIAGPKPTPSQIYDWRAARKIRVGRLGTELFASRQALAEDLTRVATAAPIKRPRKPDDPILSQ